jgi:hypothetical protein
MQTVLDSVGSADFVSSVLDRVTERNVNAVQVTSTEDLFASIRTDSRKTGRIVYSLHRLTGTTYVKSFSARSEETSVWLSTYRTHTVP